MRKLTTLPAFLREVETIVAQASKSPGYLGGAILVEGRMVAWTRTVWESEAAMKAFRDGGAHRVSMPKLVDWCDEACVAHWEGEAESDWSAIYARMSRELRLSKIRHPTEAHTQKRIAPFKRWLPERVVAPSDKENNPRA